MCRIPAISRLDNLHLARSGNKVLAKKITSAVAKEIAHASRAQIELREPFTTSHSFLPARLCQIERGSMVGIFSSRVVVQKNKKKRNFHFRSMRDEKRRGFVFIFR